jgi:hypothetical protein
MQSWNGSNSPSFAPRIVTVGMAAAARNAAISICNKSATSRLHKNVNTRGHNSGTPSPRCNRPCQIWQRRPIPTHRPQYHPSFNRKRRPPHTKIENKNSSIATELKFCSKTSLRTALLNTASAVKTTKSNVHTASTKSAALDVYSRLFDFRIRQFMRYVTVGIAIEVAISNECVAIAPCASPPRLGRKQSMKKKPWPHLSLP